MNTGLRLTYQLSDMPMKGGREPFRGSEPPCERTLMSLTARVAFTRQFYLVTATRCADESTQSPKDHFASKGRVGTERSRSVLPQITAFRIKAGYLGRRHIWNAPKGAYPSNSFQGPGKVLYVHDK